MLKLTDFDYALPRELIAQQPATMRDASRLMVLDRCRSSISHHRFSDIGQFLRPGDLLVLNDTKVIPARLIGRRRTGGRVEVFLLEKDRKDGPEDCFKALIRPLGRLKTGEEIIFGNNLCCRLSDPQEKVVTFRPGEAVRAMRRCGLLPLPPYIRRSPTRLDRVRYQTVFARNEGAVAAPTAGLHFTKPLLAALKRRGILVSFLTLHVNYATFSPVRTDDIRGHRMSPERVVIPERTVRAVRRAREAGGRIVAVGTTVCKALEDAREQVLGSSEPRPIVRDSRLFIHPPFGFRVCDALVTNFHLPRTTLLMLVAAFAGREFVLSAYAEAVRRGYRFYSYGDAMLLL